MLDEYDFHILQLRYIREAMNDFVNYRPDDLTVALVDALIAGAKTTRTDFLNAKTDFDLAMGGRNSAVTNLHDACVSVFGIMKTRFRKDIVSSEVIAKLPVDDRTPATPCGAASPPASFGASCPTRPAAPPRSRPGTRWTRPPSTPS